MSETHAQGALARLTLTIRTSLLCEFRDKHGALQAFEVCHGQTTFGILCNALMQLPGVEFPGHEAQDWFKRPARFTYGGDEFEVSIPHENIRVAPAALGQVLPGMEDILEHVRRNVLRTRASRYTVR